MFRDTHRNGAMQFPTQVFSEFLASTFHSSSGCTSFQFSFKLSALLHPTEVLLSECWTDLRNKLFYVRCTKELIIAQWLYIVACMHSGKLATEGRDLMMRIARARTVQDLSLANGSLRPSLSLSCAWGKCPFVMWFFRQTPEEISSPCLFLIKIDYSVVFFSLIKQSRTL